MTVKISMVISSHLNDLQYELASTHPDALARARQRVQFLKELVFNHLEAGEIETKILDILWKKTASKNENPTI